MPEWWFETIEQMKEARRELRPLMKSGNPAVRAEATKLYTWYGQQIRRYQSAVE